MKETIIVHDQRVYDELRRIKSTNRKLVAFAVIAGFYILGIVKSHTELKAKVVELMETKKGE